ncbi:enoyl-CoA hydratase/isomerase family protein [Streptomyces luteolus]|uniref:Enoyl-CoA hydratase/isomerase family protein n=1 Tax=Streptomyces luteolus TaxID=3043615 RepID=A0ABT6T605_9ACTN|nr:enoyl-CoA hydratase/isomerase family protein [Streptomyces sp. B-S-A12]MDI3422813.1 enoyl-CoA hydratase/isomerase family protein [Streptomyces sp. B-S-A12]
MTQQTFSVDDLKTLDVTESGAALHVRMRREGAKNVADEALLDDLADVLAHLRKRPDLRVLVLAGEETEFCLGGDRHELESLAEADTTGEAVLRVAEKARRVCEALESADVATIAAVRGPAVGAGVALALYCDLRVGTVDCTFRMPELGLGLPTAWGGALSRLIAEVGAPRIREMVLTCDVVDSARALEWSLLHRVAADSTELDKIVDRWARTIARRSPAALRGTKALMRAYGTPARSGDLTGLDGYLLATALNARQAKGR